MMATRRTFKAVKIVAVTMFAVAVAGSGAASAEQQGADLAGAKSAVAQFVGALEANDTKSLGEVVVHDPDIVAFGTDKAERWVGYDQLMAAMHAQLAAFQTTNISVRDEVVHVMPLRDGAYFSEVWDWTIHSEGKDMALKDVRTTGVLVRRHGHWRVAQFHISLPVGGQAVPY